MKAMKTAVVTIVIGQRHQAIFSLTASSIQEYAKKIGAEFVLIDSQSTGTSPIEEKFQLFALLNKYNRVIFFDADVLIRPDCPNLFEVVPEGKLGLFNEGAFVNRVQEMSQMSQICSRDLDYHGQFYNDGVIVASRSHKFLFEPPKVDIRDSFAAYFTLKVLLKRIQVHELDYRFNRMHFIDPLTGEPRQASFIIHYAGAGVQNFEKQKSLISMDQEKWQKAAPEYKFKRNILIKTHGGIGDEICAEPVIRYICEKAYPNARVIVATWFPRLFQHLPVEIWHINDINEKVELDTPYYIMESLLPPESPAWKYMSANLMNAVDFISQNCLRAILPDARKQIMQKIELSEVSEAIDALGTELNKYVLVHPGKGWPSKTFPSQYWTDVVTRIVKAGHEVVIIGKDLNEEQGTVNIDLPTGAIDARNLLSLGGLMALISQAKALVSNDSSPVHIAGAFDTGIVLIPTCKHPDHVLPIRHGRRDYKAVSVYKKLLTDEIDSTPTQIHGQTIDQIRGDIIDYLPDPKDVVAAIEKVSGEQ